MAPGGCTLPFNLDHLIKCGLDEKGHVLHCPGHTGHACPCAYKYGRGATVGPQPRDSVWNEVTRLRGRVALLLTASCSLGEVQSGVYHNRYASSGSHLSRGTATTNPCSGNGGGPKVIVSTSLGSPERRNASLSTYDHCDPVVNCSTGVRAFDFLRAAAALG